MAIEVLGRKHPSATKVVVCKNCGAELRYTNSDKREHKTTDYTGCVDVYPVIDCPDCGKMVYV